jgi:DNA-directed RNA polymerase subunit M/transcription elongation factor TFIIS
MDASIVLSAMIVALFMILINTERKQQHASRATPPLTVPTVPPRTAPWILPYPMPITPIAPQTRPTQATDETVSTKNLIETWKTSIIGLIKLAQTNLANANQYLENGDSQTAFQHALTSTENISRALLHCYGEKPEQTLGQEEALELLSKRLREEASVDYEKAAAEFTQLHASRAGQKCLATGRPDLSLPLTKGEARQAIDSATKIVSLFSRIMDEHFATEIPELRETCPKCHAMNLGVMALNETSVSYTCNRCRHRWVEPRV